MNAYITVTLTLLAVSVPLVKARERRQAEQAVPSGTGYTAT